MSAACWVLDAAKGGVATAWMLHEMTARGIVPAALVLNAVNPIMVQGAALADFTMISGFDLDITQAILNGIMVEVDLAERGAHPYHRAAVIFCAAQDISAAVQFGNQKIVSASSSAPWLRRRAD